MKSKEMTEVKNTSNRAAILPPRNPLENILRGLLWQIVDSPGFGEMMMRDHAKFQSCISQHVESFPLRVPKQLSRKRTGICIRGHRKHFPRHSRSTSRHLGA